MQGASVDPKELALQIVDIIALRPEVELCYIGIASKCFEILENRKSSTSSIFEDSHSRSDSRLADDSGDLDEEDAEDDDAEDMDDEDDGGGGDVDNTESDDDVDTSDEDSEDEIEASDGHARLRLREILFYDDKIGVFKARHGKL